MIELWECLFVKKMETCFHKSCQTQKKEKPFELEIQSKFIEFKIEKNDS